MRAKKAPRKDQAPAATGRAELDDASAEVLGKLLCETVDLLLGMLGRTVKTLRLLGDVADILIEHGELVTAHRLHVASLWSSQIADALEAIDRASEAPPQELRAWRRQLAAERRQAWEAAGRPDGEREAWWRGPGERPAGSAGPAPEEAR